MPRSAEEGRQIMVDWIMAQRPRSILDVGAGAGEYGKMLRRRTDAYLIGLEIWPPYVDQFQLKEIYDQVIVGDVRDVANEAQLRVDVIVLGDVLEHMSRPAAMAVWLWAMTSARKAVYLSIPIVPYPQGHIHGNPYEEHVVDDWTHEDVLAAFPGITWHWQGTIVGRYEAVRRARS